MSKGAIVIAEDEPSVRLLIGTLIKSIGYTPIPVKNGTECLRMLSVVRPKAVLLDFHMPTLVEPELNGLQVMEAIRRGEHGRLMPVLIVTANPEIGIVRRAVELHAANIIVKPFHPDEFLAKLTRCLLRPDG